jgi:hypothetical protein
VKVRFAALLSIISLFSVSAQAEVFVTVNTKNSDVAQIAKNTVIRVRARPAVRERLERLLTDGGYTITQDKKEAQAEVAALLHISVPQDGKAPLVDAEEIYGKGIPAIPPAIKGDVSEASTTDPVRAQTMESGVTHAGAKLTGSTSGGILLSAVIPAVANLFFENQADAKRTPGIASMRVFVRRDGKSQAFEVIAAANTPETPDTLLDSAMNAAVKGLINGVPAAKENSKSDNKEQTNAQPQ